MLILFQRFCILPAAMISRPPSLLTLMCLEEISTHRVTIWQHFSGSLPISRSTAGSATFSGSASATGTSTPAIATPAVCSSLGSDWVFEFRSFDSFEFLFLVRASVRYAYWLVLFSFNTISIESRLMHRSLWIMVAEISHLKEASESRCCNMRTNWYDFASECINGRLSCLALLRLSCLALLRLSCLALLQKTVISHCPSASLSGLGSI